MSKDGFENHGIALQAVEIVEREFAQFLVCEFGKRRKVCVRKLQAMRDPNDVPTGASWLLLRAAARLYENLPLEDDEWFDQDVVRQFQAAVFGVYEWRLAERE